MENKWIVVSINRVVPQDDIFSTTYFTARNEMSGLEKEFFSVMGDYEVGDAFYPTNEE
jgi:hypothetical protein